MLRLKKEIVDQYGTQRNFSKAAEIHETTVSNILRGEYKHECDDAKERIEKVLGLSWEELMKEI